MEWFQYVVLAAIALAIAWFVWSRFIRARPRQPPPTQAPVDRPDPDQAPLQRPTCTSPDDDTMSRPSRSPVDDPLAVVEPAGRPGSVGPVEHAPPMVDASPTRRSSAGPVRRGHRHSRAGHGIPSGRARDRCGCGLPLEIEPERHPLAVLAVRTPRRDRRSAARTPRCRSSSARSVSRRRGRPTGPRSAARASRAGGAAAPRRRSPPPGRGVADQVGPVRAPAAAGVAS